MKGRSSHRVAVTCILAVYRESEMRARIYGALVAMIVAASLLVISSPTLASNALF